LVGCTRKTFRNCELIRERINMFILIRSVEEEALKKLDTDCLVLSISFYIGEHPAMLILNCLEDT